MPTIDEALAALAEAIGGDEAKVKEAARALRASIPTLGQNLLNAGAAMKKTELQGEITRLTNELADAKTLQEETAREFDAFKQKTPDVAAVELRVRTQMQGKIDAAEAKAKASDERVVKTTRETMRARLVNELTTTHGVEKKWAERVVVADHDDRLVAQPDGTWKVLQIGSELPYDATSQDEALAKLAADAAKTVDPAYIGARVAGGGGTGGDFTGSSRSEAALTNEKRATIRRVF